MSENFDPDKPTLELVGFFFDGHTLTVTAALDAPALDHVLLRAFTYTICPEHTSEDEKGVYEATKALCEALMTQMKTEIEAEHFDFMRKFN